VNHEWSPRSIAQLVGWALIILGFVLVTGACVGQGSGAGHEPGSDTIRTLIFEKNVGRAALGFTGLGLLALLASAFMRKSDA
jgi:hypothetical protein